MFQFYKCQTQLCTMPSADKAVQEKTYILSGHVRYNDFFFSIYSNTISFSGIPPPPLPKTYIFLSEKGLPPPPLLTDMSAKWFFWGGGSPYC